MVDSPASHLKKNEAYELAVRDESALISIIELLNTAIEATVDMVTKDYNEYAKIAANTLISTSVNNQKADNISYKDAQRKNWLTLYQTIVLNRHAKSRRLNMRLMKHG